MNWRWTTVPSSKTKKLLEKLSKITDSAPKVKEQERFNSYTNRYYPDTNKLNFNLYDVSETKVDIEGDDYVMIDRVYGSLYGDTLLQKNGNPYKGKLYPRRRLLTRKDPITGEKTNFYSPCTSTADGRWFDNTGFPIEPPEKLEPEKEKAVNA